MLFGEKRGVSEIVGYLLLVVFTVIIAAIVFVWLRSYVPADVLSCPDGTSLFVKESSYNESQNRLKLVIKNNGRFDVAGFFIHATNSSTQETATIDLSGNITTGGTKVLNAIVFGTGNSFSPGDTNTVIFTLVTAETGPPYSLSIIPARYQTADRRERFVSCANAKTESLVTEPGVEIPDAQCSDGLDNDGDSCLDLNDNDCSSGSDASESGSVCATCTPSTEICNDGLDNDCDLDIDCLDAGCSLDPACSTPPQCSDGLDNDDNGCSDFPADLGCADANDNSEAGGICSGGGVGEEIGYFGFESGAQGWVDGDGSGANSQRVTTSSKVDDSGVNGGTSSWKITQNQVGSYTSKTFNVAGYSQLKVEWWGYYTGLDATHNDCLEFKAGSSLTKIKSWGSNSCDENVFASQDGWIAQEVTISSSTVPFTSDFEIRFEGEMNNANDIFYVDGIRVTKIP